MFNYPIKRKPYKSRSISTSNRGMELEKMLNESNEQYLSRDIAIIYKKPTPIQIVGVDYPDRSHAKIKEAYYKIPSTTDYNGIYKGYYIDYDAKQCDSLTSFPLNNVHPHQASHLSRIEKHGGIGFLIIYFNKLDEIFLLETKDLLKFIQRGDEGGRKSISIEEMRKTAFPIKMSYPIEIPYLSAVDLIIENRKKKS